MVYLICNSMPVFPREDDIEVNIEQEEQEVCKDLLNEDQFLFLFKNKNKKIILNMSLCLYLMGVCLPKVNILIFATTAGHQRSQKNLGFLPPPL